MTVAIKDILSVADVQAACDAAPNGANIVLEWRRPCKTLAASRHIQIEKQVRAVGRIGVRYDNMEPVKIGRATGELPAKNAGLPWGEWVEDSGYLIVHEGKFYVRVAAANSKVFGPSKVLYFMDGKAVSYETVEPHLQSSEKRNDNDKEKEKEKEKEKVVFNVPVSAMLRIHAATMQDEEPIAETPQEKTTDKEATIA